MQLRRLIYTSQASQTVVGDLAAATVDILKASVRNNALVDVTGMLLSHNGWFLQALEGSGEAVEAVYRKVAKDGRHQALKLLANDKVAQRAFSGWAMCGKAVTLADDEILKVLAIRSDVDPRRMEGGSALKLLKVIHAIHQRTGVVAAA